MELEKHHKELIYDQVVLLHIFCVCILFGVILKYFDMTSNDANFYLVKYFVPFSLIIILDILLFNMSKEKLLEARYDKVNLVVMIYVGIPILLTAVVLFYTGNIIPTAKLLFLIPILISGCIAGRKAVYCVALVCIAMVIIYDIYHFNYNLVYVIFDHNFIFISTILVTSWFSGSVADLQNVFHKELAYSKRRLEDIINFLPDATFAIDLKGKIVIWNKAIEDMTGINAENIIGKGEYEYAVPFYGIHRPLLVDQVLNPQDKLEKNYSIVCYNKDALVAEAFTPRIGSKGTFVWAKATLLYDDNGNKIGAIESLKDVTEIRILEQEIARIDRLNLVGEMAASIAHEIRNPMTTVRGMLQLLNQRPEYFKDHNNFSLMIEELDRANKIISEYLSLAKNKAIDLKEQNLNSIVEAVFPLIEANAVHLDKNITKKLNKIPDLLVDEKEIRQLLLNLVRNGLEAMAPGGTLTISTYKEEDDVVLSIIDQGKGISPELLDKLGRPFLTTKEDGTGLGLSVCYSIAARHNAEIEVESDQSGTTFKVKFNNSANQA